MTTGLPQLRAVDSKMANAADSAANGPEVARIRIVQVLAELRIELIVAVARRGHLILMVERYLPCISSFVMTYDDYVDI